MNCTVFGVFLSFTTLLAAGYTLRSMCIARRMRRDPRPFAATVFALVAYAVMQITWVMSGSMKVVDPYYNNAWHLVDAVLIGCIWWLVIVASGIRGRRK